MGRCLVRSISDYLKESGGKPVKLRHERWANDQFVEFYFVDSKGMGIGTGPDGVFEIHPESDPDGPQYWLPYTEPKPKVRRFLWEYTGHNGNIWHPRHWASEAEQAIEQTLCAAGLKWRKSCLMPEGREDDE